MTRKRYRCPECSGVFVYDHHPSIEADPLPDDAACPHCNFVSESEYPAALVAPHIRSKTIVATVDNMHRDIEEGEKFRANVAMEKFGLDADEARQMVATNTLDNLRENETSFVPVNNPVSQMIAAAPQFGFGNQSTAQFGMAQSPHVQSGLYPNAGAHAMAAVRASHGSLVASTGHKAAVTSSLPALETEAPGYRKRV